MSESKCLVASLEIGLLRLVLLIVVLEVAKVFSTSNPSFLELLVLFGGLTRLFSFLDPFLSLLGVHEHFHSFVVKTFAFYHIKHIKLNFETFFDICNSEEEPLGMSFRVDIVLEDKVILVV